MANTKDFVIKNGLTYNGTATSTVVDGGSAVQHLLNGIVLATTGAKLLSIQNNSVEKMYVDKDGYVNAPIFTASSGVFQNNNTIAGSTSVASNSNALTVGPITINSGVNFTVPSGSVWSLIDDPSSPIPVANAITASLAGNVTGIVGIANGGTGQITAQLAINALAGVTVGSYLRGNGTNAVMSSIPVAEVVGAATDSLVVHLAGTETITGVKTFSPVTDVIPVIVNAVTGQTAKLQSWQVAGVEKASIDKDGIGAFNGVVSHYMKSPVADGASAVAVYLDTPAAYSTAGAKLLSIRNATVEKAYVDKDGYVYSANSLVWSAANLTQPAFIGAKNLAGFDDRTSSTLNFNNTTRVFTLTITGTCVVWSNNTKRSFTTTQTAVPTIANTIGFYYFYIDSAGALVSSTTPWTMVSDQIAPVATVYWNGTTGAVSDERHNSQRDRLLHEYLHDTRGAAYEAGFAGTFTNTTFSVAAGVFYDEDIEFTPTTQTTARVFYRNSGGTTMTFEDLTTPYKAAAGVLQWDDAGTLTAVVGTGGGNYVKHFVYATNDKDRPIYIVIGQGSDSAIASVRAFGLPTIPNIPTREWKLIYTIIYRNVSGTATYVESSDLRTTSSISGAGVSSMPAASVIYSPKGLLTATNVQGALDQITDTKAYGSVRENSAGSNITLTTQNTAYQWITGAAGVLDANSLITFNNTNKQLVVGTGGAGDYHVAFHTSFACDTNSQVILGSLYVAGNQSVVQCSSEATPVNSIRTITATGIVTLAVGDTIDVRFANQTSAGKVMTITHAGLIVRRL